MSNERQLGQLSQLGLACDSVAQQVQVSPVPPSLTSCDPNGSRVTSGGISTLHKRVRVVKVDSHSHLRNRYKAFTYTSTHTHILRVSLPCCRSLQSLLILTRLECLMLPLGALPVLPFPGCERTRASILLYLQGCSYADKNRPSVTYPEAHLALRLFLVVTEARLGEFVTWCCC